ncbi:MAG: pyridoxamine 5'-phosphate oxidase family protein [Candidatus Latescibacteria bacterium]|nr:pyridoxamine 5'-phosphate oxidase family protein [Candidatus Latescibacterota bacterium]
MTATPSQPLHPQDAKEPANRFQEQFGQPSEGARTKVRELMEEGVQEFIRHAPFAVLATSNADGRCDASPRGGTPGFVRVLDERRLLMPDVAGNRLFQSYGNIDSNSGVGLLFFIPGLERTVRINGRARPIDAEEAERLQAELAVYWHDDNTKLLQGLLIEVEEAYGHCPRALKFSNLWDAGTIERNRQDSPLS